MATTITVVCPHCTSQMRAPVEYLGRQGRCPTCKKLVEIKASKDDPSLLSLAATGADGRTSKRPASSSTDTPAWLAGLIGLAASAILYIVLFLPLKNTYFGELFVKRGIIPYVTVLVTCWGLAMLILKLVAVKRQQSYADLELELIPLEVGVEITPANVNNFLGHLASVPAAQRDSILGRRIKGALEHFKSRNSVPEVQQYLATQAEIDASSVDAGYMLLRSFIWAVPILGFIGTVMGISDAVSGLSSTLGAGGDIRDGLGGITTGLSTAFDTTLIALTMAILLLFPTESLRKTEYRMLDRIEAFANEQLLRRMSNEDRGLDPENMPEIVRHALESAFQEHQRWLAQWQAQVGELGRVIGTELEQAVMRIQQQISQNEAGRLQKLDSTGQMLDKVFDKMLGNAEIWNRSEAKLADESQQMMEFASRLEPAFENALQQLRDEIGRLAEKLADIKPPIPDPYATGEHVPDALLSGPSPVPSGNEHRKRGGWFGFGNR